MLPAAVTCRLLTANEKLQELAQGVAPHAETGAFQRIPHIPPAEEHLASALKRGLRVTTNVKLKNEAARAKNLAARQMDQLTKLLATPLGAWVKGFPRPQSLHKFEQVQACG